MSELYHHGILGQKWGVRRYQNKDGTLTELGKQRYVNAWKEESPRVGYNTKVSSIYSKAGLNSKPFISAQKQLKQYSDEANTINKEADSMFKGYQSKSRYHQQIAGAVNSLADGDKKIGSIAKNIYFYECEDGDQSFYNSNLSYLRSEGKVNQAVNMVNRYNAASENYKSEAKKAVSKILGEHGDELVTKTSMPDYTVTKSIVSHLAQEAYGRKDSGIWRAKEAIGITSDLNSRKAQKYYNAENTAKELVAKMTKGKSSWNLVQAVENAGLNDVDFDKMTSSQWAKLETELNKLGYK